MEVGRGEERRGKGDRDGWIGTEPHPPLRGTFPRGEGVWGGGEARLTQGVLEGKVLEVTGEGVFWEGF